MKIKNTIYLFLLLATSYIMGQNPYSFRIDKSQGLLSNSVYDIFEAKNGLMWFASDKGLCSFNGYTFKYFNQENMTAKAGSCIREDKFGRIWYQNFDGYLYYVENNTLKKLNQKKAIGYFKFGFINDQLYIINEKGLDVYDLKKLSYTKTIAFDTSYLFTVAFDQNKIYVFTKNLKIIENDQIQEEIVYPEDFIKNFNSILVEKSDEGLLICAKYSDYCYYLTDSVFKKKKLSIQNTIVQNLSWCNNQNWLCTTTGLLQIDKKNNTLTNYFEGVNLSYIYKTKNSNYWVSTLTQGLYFIENFDTQLVSTDEVLTSVLSNKDHLFIGTNGDKILKFDKNSTKLKTIYSGKTNHQIGQLYYDNYSQQLLFTSAKFGFLNAKNHLDKEFNIAVKKVFPIDSKYIAFASSSSLGIFKLNAQESSEWDTFFNSFIHTNNPDYCDIITNAKGKATVYDKQNNTILYATNNGLFAVSKTSKIKEILLNNRTINCNTLSTKNGIIYAANNDLKLFEIKNLKAKEIQIPLAIDKNTVEKSFLKNDLFFVVSNSYIYEYSIQKNTVKTILKVNNENEINDIIKENSTYYITSNSGLIIKKSSSTNLANPTFNINLITENDRVTSQKKRANLSYDENNISIYFTLLSAIPFEEVSLKYRINGAAWQKLTTANSKLVLNSLNSGNYTVEFSLNNILIQNQKAQFTINKPFWFQWPFALLFTFVTIIILYLVYCENINKIKKRNQLVLDKINLEKNVNQSKLKAIKSQMNPHFFYNALNTLQSYILSNEKRQAIDYLSKFSNLTRIILEMTEKETVSIAEEAKTLQLYLDIEKGRFDDNFDFDIKIDAEIDQEKIKIPTMLLQPYVENAIKHGLLHKIGSKNVTIYFHLIHNELQILIDDNGIGRQKSAELNSIKNKNHRSFATTAIQNRIDLLNEYNHKNIRLEIIDKQNKRNQPTGTTVEIIIPNESDS